MWIWNIYLFLNDLRISYLEDKFVYQSRLNSFTIDYFFRPKCKRINLLLGMIRGIFRVGVSDQGVFLGWVRGWFQLFIDHKDAISFSLTLSLSVILNLFLSMCLLLFLSLSLSISLSLYLSCTLSKLFFLFSIYPSFPPVFIFELLYLDVFSSAC